MSKRDAVPLLVVGAGVFWYLYRQKAKAAVAQAEPEPLDYINPASPDFVVNKAAKVVGIDLHALGQRLGAGLYDLTH